MNTLALYCRASNEDANGTTAGGTGESATIQNQRDLLLHYVKSKPEFADWNVLEFQDDGWSGTTFQRPGVQKMLQMAGSGIQCIIVKDFSRFGRNLIEVGDYLDQVFPFLGVRFIAVNENYDSKDNKGRTVGLDVSLKAMVYEMYSRDLSQKIGSVKEAQMKKGQYIGRIAFYGYVKSPAEKHKLVVDAEAADVVRRIFTLAADGMKPIQIAIRFNAENLLPPFRYRQKNHPNAKSYCAQVTKNNVWTRENVRDIIKDERYTGCFLGRKATRIDISTKKVKRLPKDQWIRVEDAFEAIVSKELFRKAQAVLEPERSKETLRHPTEPFRGLARCEGCGRVLKICPSKNPYLYCFTGKFAPDSPCANVRVDKAELEQTVLTSLQAMIHLVLKADGGTREDISQEGSIRKNLERLLTEIEKRRAERVILFERFADGKLSKQDYLTQKQSSTNRIGELEAEKNKLIVQLQNLEQAEGAPSAKDLGKYSFANTLTREMLVELVDTIRVSPDNTIEIVWKFADKYTHN